MVNRKDRGFKKGKETENPFQQKHGGEKQRVFKQKKNYTKHERNLAGPLEDIRGSGGQGKRHPKTGGKKRGKLPGGGEISGDLVSHRLIERRNQDRFRERPKSGIDPERITRSKNEGQ